MTTPLLPPFYVDPPAAPPASYGLFSVAMGPMPLPVHGIGGGMEYLTDWCTGGHLYPSVCDATPPTKTFDEADETAIGLPFRAYASLVCGAQTFDFEVQRGRVERRLAATEQTQAEAALWGVSTADVPGYFQTATVTTLAAAADPVEAIALLEQQLAECYGHPGIIHARPRMAAYLADRFQVPFKEGGILKTLRGNVVVFGDGYSGLGPADEPPTASTEWMYATGRVAVWRSDDVTVPDPRQTFSRSDNQYMMLAERDYALLAECCIAATEVTIP